MNVHAQTAIKLKITRHFDTPPERLFDAWLSKSWGEWVGPPGVNGEVVQLEPRAGGHYRVVMHREGGDLTVGGVYKEINRPSRIVMSWKWEHEEVETLVTLSFRPAGTGTELTLLHEGFGSEERRDGHNLGWNGTLDRLAAKQAKA